jgi:hypothetical protein
MKLSMLLALALLLPGAAVGVTPAEEIAALEAQFEAGLAARDAKLLDGLLARPFTWVHSSDGRVDDREAWLASAARGMALAAQHRDRSEHGATLQLHGDPPHTAVRISRVRLADAQRESWIRQTHTWVRGAAGKWQLAMGQGVVMYDGPLLDATLPARYAGVYALEDGRRLVLEWQDGMLLATLPNGAQAQVFLASPTDEVVRTPAAGSLHFTLDEHGVPNRVSLLRADQEVWRAARKAP